MKYNKLVKILKGEGSFLKMKLRGVLLNLLNYYGPIFDDTEALQQIYDLLIPSECSIIWGGDFNYIQDIRLDTSNSAKKQLKPKTTKLINRMKQELTHLDPWIHSHPGQSHYTCYSSRYKSASRIDFFIIQNLLSRGESEIISYSFSDHSAISTIVTLNITGLRITKRWYFDKSFLEDLDWIKEMQYL